MISTVNMVNSGMIDIEALYNLGGDLGVLTWRKFEPIILIQRELYNDPRRYRWLEFLANEMMKERERQGISGQLIDADGYTTANTIP